MAQQLKILNSKEIKEIRQKLEGQFGYTSKLDVVWMLSEKKEKLYIFTRDLANIDVSGLKIDTMGLYFASTYKGELRLTIEGSQLIGKECAKNILEVTHEQMQCWLQGEKLYLKHDDGSLNGYVIIKHGEDYLGSGKTAHDEQGHLFILNYVPKTRYIRALYEKTGAEGDDAGTDGVVEDDCADAADDSPEE